MISRFGDFIKISFVQDVGVLQVGKLFSILLSVASSVIIARLLHPELYGVYGLIFAFVGLIGIFMNWGGMYAGLTLLAEAYTKKDKQEIKNTLTYFLKVTVLATCIIGVLSFILAPFLTEQLYDNSQIGSWARIILLAVFSSAIYSLLLIVLQVVRKIKQLTILETFNKFIYTLLPIIFVLVGWGLTGIVWGHLISTLIFLILSIFVYSSLAEKDELLPSLKQLFLSFRRIRLRKYFNFGFSIAFDKNLGRLISILPVILLGVFTLVQEVGYLKIALSYIAISTLILEPISRLLAVQLPKSKADNLQIFKKHFYKTTGYSGIISVLSIIPFVILAPYLIKFFYGAEYISSIELIYWLSPLILVSGLSVGISSFYRTVNRMKTSIIINAGHIILMAVLICSLSIVYNLLMTIVWSIVLSAVIFFGRPSLSHQTYF